MLHKLGQEDDAYHAVGLLMIEYGDEVAIEEGQDVADDGEDSLAAAGLTPEEPVEAEAPETPSTWEAGLDLSQLPRVDLFFDERAHDIHPARFLATMVRRTIAATPVNRHREARDRLKNPTVEAPSNLAEAPV